MGFRRAHQHSPEMGFYLDLRPLEKITPAAALLLVAELQRWNILHRRKMQSRDVDQWNPTVRSLLRQMGFFELLNAEVPPDEDDLSKGIIFLPFHSGKDTDGAPIRKLRQMIEQRAGALQGRARRLLFQGVSEAITNVVHHAYPKSRTREQRAAQYYWMSASIDMATGAIIVMVLDHGVGIPRSFPRKAPAGMAKRMFMLQIAKFLSARSMSRFDDDVGMIEAAIELGQTSTGFLNRGHGLTRDIKALPIQIGGTAKLRIVSNRGVYIYTHSGDGTENVRAENRRNSLDGTFIEWQFQNPQMDLFQ